MTEGAVTRRPLCSVVFWEVSHGLYHASVRPSDRYAELEQLQPACPRLDCTASENAWAVSFIAYRATNKTSPDTFTMLEFRTMQEAQHAAASEPIKRIIDELRAAGAAARVLLVERSPFTPEPILA